MNTDFLRKNKIGSMRNSKLLVISSLMIVFTIISSCKDSFCDELILKLEEATCNEELRMCMIDMKDLFKQDWEYIYIFQGYNTPEDISEALGFNYVGRAIYDPSRLIILVSDKTIVESFKTECLSFNIDKLLKSNYLRVESENSKFIMSKIDDERGRRYIFESEQ